MERQASGKDLPSGSSIQLEVPGGNLSVPSSRHPSPLNSEASSAASSKRERSDGEITDDDELKRSKKPKIPSKKTQTEITRERKAKGKAKRQGIEKAKEEENKQKILDDMKGHFETILKALFGGDKIHVYFVAKRTEILEKLKDIEEKTRGPINPNNPEFKQLNFTWLHEPGLHFGFDTTEMEIAFVVRIRPLVNISGADIKPILESISTIMDWTFAVSQIKINAASQPVHGINATKSTQGNGPEGKMFCAGWRRSFGPGEQFAAYAAKNSAEGHAEYARLRPKLPVVGKAFMEGFSSLYPGGYQSMREAALSEGTPSFADTDFVDEPGTKSLVPFGISLAITREDFSNYLHKDNDYTADAYGWWWPAQWDDDSKRYIFNNKASHQDVKGGCFIWGDYGFGVDFEKCDGLVEIYWRGKTDYHCTLKSLSRDKTTRFGTSTQLTKKGVEGFRSWLQNDRLRSGIATFQDRMNGPSKKGKKATQMATGKKI